MLLALCWMVSPLCPILDNDPSALLSSLFPCMDVLSLSDRYGIPLMSFTELMGASNVAALSGSLILMSAH